VTCHPGNMGNVSEASRGDCIVRRSGGLGRTGAFSGRFPLRDYQASQARSDLATRAEIHSYLPRCTGFVFRSSAPENRDSLGGNQQMWVSPLLSPLLPTSRRAAQQRTVIRNRANTEIETKGLMA